MDNFITIWPHRHTEDGRCIYEEPRSFETREKAIGHLLSAGVPFTSARWAVDEGAWLEEALVSTRRKGEVNAPASARQWFSVTISSLTYRNGLAL